MHHTMKNDPEDTSKEETQGSGLLQQKMLASRSIIISGEINQALAEKVVTQLILLQSINNDPIKIYINS